MQLEDVKAYEYLEINIKNRVDWHVVEILKTSEKTITVTLPKNLKGFFVGDEVKCRFTDGKSTYVFEGEIFDVIFKHPQAMVLFVPGQIRKYDEFRKEKRYATSLLAEVYKLKKFYGYVKDVSRKGLCLLSKGFLEKGDEIGITLFYGREYQQIYFEGVVVRKEEYGSYKEYGIEITNIRYEEEDKLFKLIEELEKQSATIVTPEK